jgi:EasF-like predicted methyltransferase
MKKAALLLRALHSQHKSVEYFACDVDVSALKRGVSKLRAYFADSGLSTKIHGLLGTYEDCAAWLDSEPGTTSTSLVWFGNSMANFTPQEASKYIQGFLSSGSTMIVALDGSQDQKEIADSYEGQPNRDFILNGLSHANQILGEAVFAVDDWGFLGMWNTDTYMHESFYVARQDLSVDVCGEVYHFEMGETMRSIRSGKWPRQKVMEICKDAGGRVTKCWMNQEQSYGKSTPCDKDSIH